MTKKRNKINLGIDKWFFLISGVLVATLLTIAIITMFFLGGQIFQSFAPIDNNDAGLKYNLEGYRNLNLSVEDGT